MSYPAQLLARVESQLISLFANVVMLFPGYLSSFLIVAFQDRKIYIANLFAVFALPSNRIRKRHVPIQRKAILNTVLERVNSAVNKMVNAMVIIGATCSELSVCFLQTIILSVCRF